MNGESWRLQWLLAWEDPVELVAAVVEAVLAAVLEPPFAHDDEQQLVPLASQCTVPSSSPTSPHQPSCVLELVVFALVLAVGRAPNELVGALALPL